MTREQIFKEFKEFDSLDIGPKLMYLQELKQKLSEKDYKLDINVDALLDYYTEKYCK